MYFDTLGLATGNVSFTCSLYDSNSLVTGQVSCTKISFSGDSCKEHGVRENIERGEDHALGLLVD